MFQGTNNVEKLLPEKMNAVADHLSLVFHRYLSSEEGLKKLSISVNNMPVEPSDPFLKHKNTQKMAEESLSIAGYPPIRIVPFMLPYPSKLSPADRKLLGITEDMKRNQGFYVYRNKRLIVWGTWFRRAKKEMLSQLARIQIDIPPAFDSLWVLDVKKSVAEPPSVFRKNLDGIINNLAEHSKRTWTYRGKKEIDKNVRHVWNRIKTREDGIIYEINLEHPNFLRLIEKFPACETEFKNLLKLIAAELPLNQLTLDLTGGKVEIENSGLYTADAVREILKIFTAGQSVAAIDKLLDNLSRDEPYKNFPQVIEEFRRSEDYD